MKGILLFTATWPAVSSTRYLTSDYFPWSRNYTIIFCHLFVICWNYFLISAMLLNDET